MTTPILTQEEEQRRQAWTKPFKFDVDFLPSTLEQCAKDWFRGYSDFHINNTETAISNPFENGACGSPGHPQKLMAFWKKQFFGEETTILTLKQQMILNYAGQYFYNGGCFDPITPLLQDTFQLQGLTIKNLNSTKSPTYFSINENIVTIEQSLKYTIENAFSICGGIAQDPVTLNFKASSTVTLDFNTDDSLPTVTSEAILTTMCKNTAKYLTDSPYEAIQQLQIERQMRDAEQAFYDEVFLLEKIRASLAEQINIPMTNSNANTIVHASQTQSHLAQELRSITNDQQKYSKKNKHTNDDITGISRLTNRLKSIYRGQRQRPKHPRRHRAGWGFFMMVGVCLIAATAIIASPALVPATAAVAVFVAPKAAFFIGGGLLTLGVAGAGFNNASINNTKNATLDALDDQNDNFAQQQQIFNSTKKDLDTLQKLNSLKQKYTPPQVQEGKIEEEEKEAGPTISIEQQDLQLLSLALNSNNRNLRKLALQTLISTQMLTTLEPSFTTKTEVQHAINTLSAAQQAARSTICEIPTGDAPINIAKSIDTALTFWKKKLDHLETNPHNASAGQKHRL